MKTLFTITLCALTFACVTVNKGNGTYTIDGSGCVRYNPGNCISHDDSNGRYWIGCVGGPKGDSFPAGGKGPGEKGIFLS